MRQLRVLVDPDHRLGHLGQHHLVGLDAHQSRWPSQYIKAFNRQYPNIHVTYKMLTIAGYNAALRPGAGLLGRPDVFDVAPGGANGSVETYGPDAVNLEPAVEQGARQRLEVQALPDRRRPA